jgi:hypothetical protein
MSSEQPSAPTPIKAAIDMGTNSMHLVVARLAEHGGFEILTSRYMPLVNEPTCLLTRWASMSRSLRRPAPASMSNCPEGQQVDDDAHRFSDR